MTTAPRLRDTGPSPEQGTPHPIVEAKRRFSGFRGLANTALVAALGGCLVSEQPLFPSGRIVAQTPIKAGWYLRQDIKPMGGQRHWAPELVPVYVGLNGKTYSYHVNDDGVEASFQLFASAPNESTFIAQSPQGQGLWGYQQVGMDGPQRFWTQIQRCRGEGATMDATQLQVLREAGIIQKVSGSNCYFNDPDKLSAMAGLTANWPNAPTSIFIRVLDKDVFTFAKLKHPPRTLDPCESATEYPRQTFDPAFAKEGLAQQGLHRHVIAATGRTGTSTQFALSVEADGNKTLPWAFLSYSNEQTSEAFCVVNKIIQVEAILPKQPMVVPGANPRQVAQTCAKTSATACGTLPEMLKAFSGRVLLQGREVYRFPGTGLSLGPLLTIVGQPGKTTLTVLATAPSGETRVTFQH